tara:strand:+ start:1927 stop:2334 length:408 start_codon:yes stop_codon:yes gene_type:complete
MGKYAALSLRLGVENNVGLTDNNKKGDSVMETTTFRYDCTLEADHIIKQEVHFIEGQYFLVSKIDGPETMVFHCTEAGNVLDWGGEFAVYEDIDIAETVKRFKAKVWKHNIIKLSDELKAEANACNERFRQSDGE